MARRGVRWGKLFGCSCKCGRHDPRPGRCAMGWVKLKCQRENLMPSSSSSAETADTAATAGPLQLLLNDMVVLKVKMEHVF